MQEESCLFSLSDGALDYKMYLGGPTNRKIHQMGFRVNGNNLASGYAWRMQNSGGDGGFFKYTTGSWAQIGTTYADVTANTWYNVEEKVVGTNFEAFVNGAWGTEEGTPSENIGNSRINNAKIAK